MKVLSLDHTLWTNLRVRTFNLINQTSIPRAATGIVFMILLFCSITNLSTIFTATQTWFGITVTISPIDGLFLQSFSSKNPCSSENLIMLASGYSVI